MKRYIGVLLCITVLITCFVALPSLALTVSPQSMAIETTQAEIHHIGNGIMSCYSRVTLWQGYRANLEMTLQKKTLMVLGVISHLGKIIVPLNK